MSFASFGNDLYTGARSIDVVGRRRLWYTISLVLVAVCAAGLGVRGLTPGLEFTGGTEISLRGVADPSSLTGQDALQAAVPEAGTPRVSTVGDDQVRVQTERLSSSDGDDAVEALASAYDVPAADVTLSSVGPTWGQDVTTQAIIALVVFLLLAGLVLAVYFRTWRMSVAALVALFHDVAITVGVYAIVGLEVTPATVIGFLTILGYSLYDTVVVFDKIRENTDQVLRGSRLTYAESVNLAVNQTMIRSINTSVVALLPVASILFIGALALGAGTLTDIALALFVGLIAGTYSSVFIAPSLYAQLMARTPEVAAHTERVETARAEGVDPGGRSRAVAGSRLGVMAPRGTTTGAHAGAATAGRGDGGTAVAERPAGGAGADGSRGPAGHEEPPTGGRADPGTTGGAGARPAAEDGRARRGPRNQPVRRRKR